MLEITRSVLLWCTVLNYALLLLWFLLFTLAHDWLQRRWTRWCPISVETFDATNFALIVLYKMGILFFNLVPVVALYIVSPH
jgi:hypothetical protein